MNKLARDPRAMPGGSPPNQMIQVGLDRRGADISMPSLTSGRGPAQLPDAMLGALNLHISTLHRDLGPHKCLQSERDTGTPSTLMKHGHWNFSHLYKCILIITGFEIH